MSTPEDLGQTTRHSGDAKGKDNLIAAVAGASAGTTLAGLITLMPDSILRSALLILAPAIGAIITSSWKFITEQVAIYVELRLIRARREMAEELYKKLKRDRTTDKALLQRAKESVDEFKLMEIDMFRQFGKLQQRQ